MPGRTIPVFLPDPYPGEVSLVGCENQLIRLLFATLLALREVGE